MFEVSNTSNQKIIADTVRKLMDKLEILGNDQKHEIRLDKVIEYVLGHYSQQYPSFYQHVLDEIPSIKFRLGLHYRQKEDEFKKLLNSSDILASILSNLRSNCS